MNCKFWVARGNPRRGLRSGEKRNRWRNPGLGNNRAPRTGCHPPLDSTKPVPCISPSLAEQQKVLHSTHCPTPPCIAEGSPATAQASAGSAGDPLDMSDWRESSLSPLDPRLPSLAPQGSQVSSMEGTSQQAVGLESFSAPSGLENPLIAADTDGSPTPGPGPGSTFSSLSAPTGTEIPGPCEHLWPLRTYQKQSLRAPEVPSHTKKASQSLWKCSCHWIHSPQK